MSAGKYLRLTPQSGQSPMIQESGMASLVPRCSGDTLEHEDSIGEYTAKMLTAPDSANRENHINYI